MRVRHRLMTHSLFFIQLLSPLEKVIFTFLNLNICIKHNKNDFLHIKKVYFSTIIDFFSYLCDIFKK